MREGVSGVVVAVAAVLCCALPLLIISGVFVTAGGLALSQVVLLSAGVLIVILAGLSWIALKRRNNMDG